MADYISRYYERLEITNESVIFCANKQSLRDLVDDFSRLHSHQVDTIEYFNKRWRLLFRLDKDDLMDFRVDCVLARINIDTVDSLIFLFNSILSGKVSPIRTEEYVFSDKVRKDVERALMFVFDFGLFFFGSDKHQKGEFWDFDRKWSKGKHK